MADFTDVYARDSIFSDRDTQFPPRACRIVQYLYLRYSTPNAPFIQLILWSLYSAGWRGQENTRQYLAAFYTNFATKIGRMAIESDHFQNDAKPYDKWVSVSIR